MNPLQTAVDKIAEHVALEGERVRDEVRAGLAQTSNALRVTGARYVPVYPNSLAATSAGRLVGWSLRETSTTAPAVVTVHDGRDTSAPILAVIPLTAGGGHNVLPSNPGVSFGDAAYLEVTGAVAGALYFGAVD